MLLGECQKCDTLVPDTAIGNFIWPLTEVYDKKNFLPAATTSGVVKVVLYHPCVEPMVIVPVLTGAPVGLPVLSAQ